ncbi:MAG: polyphenol oxidase family protein [Acidimicrobiales bacterium]
MHGGRVVVVDQPGASAGLEADASVTATPGCALVVRTADCGPLVLRGERAVGVVHVGWRGLAAGVVGNAVRALADLDAGRLTAHLGPCIRPGCYEFSGPERAALAERFGPGVLAATTWGTPALDLPAAIAAALVEAGVTYLQDEAPCTACDTRWFSHRARAESGRFATVAWIPS